VLVYILIITGEDGFEFKHMLGQKRFTSILRTHFLTVRRHLQGKIINDGLLSRLQLEGVLYAGQRHQRTLPNGRRAGFFIADGAGVGKGRQLSGIILDNFSRGRTKHVWVSISGDLRLDAERDLKDIGCHVNVIDGCKGLDAQKSSSTSTGVLFVTYSTLISSGSGERHIAKTSMYKFLAQMNTASTA
jgi:P-loop containing NTP hydrolase pore-1